MKLLYLIVLVWISVFPGSAFEIGNNTKDTMFDGKIDDYNGTFDNIRMWSSQLNDTDISEIHNNLYNNSIVPLPPEAKIIFRETIYVHNHQWQFDFWSFLAGMIVYIYIKIILNLRKKKYA